MEGDSESSSGASAPTMSTSSSPNMDMGGSEGNMNSSNNFSSKGFSDFKPGIEQSAKPMFDINKGHEGKSMFKNTTDFGKEKSMFDLSKPISPDTNKKYEEHVQNQIPENKNSIIDINKGHEDKSIFKDVGHIKNEKNIIDISNPIRDEKIVPHKSENADGNETKNFAETENTVHENEIRLSQEQDVYEDRTVLWERHDNDKKLDISPPEKPAHEEVSKDANTPLEKNEEQNLTHPHVDDVSESSKKDSSNILQEDAELLSQIEFQPEVRTDISTQMANRVDTSEKILPDVRTKINAQKDILFTEHGLVEQMVKTEVLAQPEVSPSPLVEPKTHPIIQTERVRQIEQEVKTQVRTLLATEIMSETNASFAQVQVAINKIIEDEESVEVIPEVKTLEQEKPTQITKKATIEEKAREIYKKRKEEIARNIKNKEPKMPEPELLFIQKDKEANLYREMAVLFAAQRMQAQGEEVVGHTIAENISHSIKNNGKSEIVEGLQDDKSVDDFVNEVRKIGKLKDLWSLREKLKGITDKITAVKLSFSAKDVAAKEDAIRVYGKSLDEVDANVIDDGSVGELLEEQTGEVVYINKKKIQGYSVEPSE